jgi:hypothetical protein
MAFLRLLPFVHRPRIAWRKRSRIRRSSVFITGGFEHGAEGSATGKFGTSGVWGIPFPSPSLDEAAVGTVDPTDPVCVMTANAMKFVRQVAGKSRDAANAIHGNQTLSEGAGHLQANEIGGLGQFEFRRHSRLPSSEAIPLLGQVTWHMAEDPRRRVEEIVALRLGVELGMSLIDTAELYAAGGAEELVGEAIEGRRNSASADRSSVAPSCLSFSMDAKGPSRRQTLRATSSATFSRFKRASWRAARARSSTSGIPTKTQSLALPVDSGAKRNGFKRSGFGRLCQAL